MALPTPFPADVWTAERVRQELLRDDEYRIRYEFVDGEVLVTPAPLPPHFRAQRWLFVAIHAFVVRHGLGETILPPADLELERNSIVQPDISVAFPGMLPPGGLTWRTVTALRLAVEVLSRGSHRHDRFRKRWYYQRNGVGEYWIVDLDGRYVERWRPGDDRPEVLHATLAWQPSPDVPPLMLDLRALFDDACGPEERFVAPPLEAPAVEEPSLRPEPSDDPPDPLA